MDENTKEKQQDFKSYFKMFENLVRHMYRPMDPSSLGIIRFLFGLLMLVDLSEERGGADIDLRWGEPGDCHFPLFPLLRPLSFPYMALMYGIMWFGAFGIMLGYKFRVSVILFGVPYWYILVLDKSFWNNHSYLYGIITILLAGSSANHFLSIDGILDETKRNRHVPYWNYFILKYQFFILYFLAGLKKTDSEWLEGYSMTNLGNHWVFAPFTMILTTEQIDYFIIHWFGFFLDLTIGFWMLIKLTRPLAMLFCACFHLMNSRLFSIGMFPYVCLATMPLFCEENWPRKLQKALTGQANFQTSPSFSCIYSNKQYKKFVGISLPNTINWKHRFVVGLLLTHCGLQTFLPYSHFITKGFNNWTNGLYGYSWDMMVHSWDTILVIVKVENHNSGTEQFLDPQAWTQNDRWTKHGDMCVQYAHCVKNNLIDLKYGKKESILTSDITKTDFIPENISIYVDVWCSLNGRFQQRMYNPNYDLLKASWSLFQPVEWLLPVLSEYNNFRIQMQQISKEVYAWSNYSDVLFVADFPGMYLENYISPDLNNITLTILEGEVIFEVENEEINQSFGVKLTKGSGISVEKGVFHKIHTIGTLPSCYMYTYINKTKELLKDEHFQTTENGKKNTMYSPFPLIEDMEYRIESLLRMAKMIYNSILHILFKHPLHRRRRIIF